MKTIHGTATVSDDGVLTLRVDDAVEPGEHEATVWLADPPPRLSMHEFLARFKHDLGHWPQSGRLRREDFYPAQPR